MNRDQKITNFQNELEKYIAMDNQKLKKVSDFESLNLAILGNGVSVDNINSTKPCRYLLLNFLNIGGSLQLRKFVECEKYMRYMQLYSNSNSN